MIDTTLPVCSFVPGADPAVTFNITTVDGQQCHFPFYDKLTRATYDACSTDTTSGLLRERLGVDKNDQIGWCKTDSASYGLCDPSNKGVWSGFIRYQCSKPCDGGVFQSVRVCLYPPCTGSATVESGKSCNTHLCQNHVLRVLGGTSAHMTRGGDHCHFPFYFAGIIFNHCIEHAKCGRTCRNGHSPPYGASTRVCSISSNLEQDRRWGYCPQNMAGMWTQWSEWSRMKVMGIECGMVKKRRSRTCR